MDTNYSLMRTKLQLKSYRLYKPQILPSMDKLRKKKEEKKDEYNEMANVILITYVLL